MSEVVIPAGQCLIWGCDKPLRAADGTKMGSRSMCWQHLKQAQREGDLIPWRRRPKRKQRCAMCNNWAIWRLGSQSGPGGQPLCHAHYASQWRQTTPNRADVLRRDRERKRAKRELEAA